MCLQGFKINFVHRPLSMKRKFDEHIVAVSSTRYHTTTPPDLPAEVVGEIPKYLDTITDLRKFHTINKFFYEKWSNREYLAELLTHALKQNESQFSLDRRGNFVKNIYNIESTQKALTILQIIIESLPDVVWIMSSSSHHLLPLLSSSFKLCYN